MIQELLNIIQAHPVETTAAGFSGWLVSEVLGFTKRGGLLKAVGDTILAAAAAVQAFRKARKAAADETTPEDAQGV